ncbi:hypothetical protein NMG60_11024871 [Bertholletia excelsa]
MSHLDLTSCKKRKRGEKVFKFKTFCEQGYPVDWDGTFLQNVKALLELGNVESDSCVGMASWSFKLELHRQRASYLLLFVVEEPVEASLHRHCKHCQYVGWGHHMICNKKYHFLLPSKDISIACLDSQGNCDKLEPNNGKLKGHILHGIFHSNGFGHLICLNGLEVGSILPGYQIMEFWDRLCSGLRVRKVSINDISQKKSMDMRLLHGVAYGKPWFGRWGYRFGRGSYGVTQQMYQKSIEAIQKIPLCLLLHHLSPSNNEIPIIFSRYQALSGHTLATLGDIFQFMLELKSHLPEENTIDSYKQGIFVGATCRWSPKRVEMATRVIVEALKRAEFRWVSRQEVRDAARVYIGDTGLLDFVLKSLGNHIVGNFLVRRSLNPVTNVSDSKINTGYTISRVQLMKDTYHLYRYTFKEHNSTMAMTMFATIPIASRIILDTKYLVKEYYDVPPSNVEVGMTSKSKMYCTVVLRNENDVNASIKNVMAPYECFVLKNDVTFDELKQQVQLHFREIYWGLKSFELQSTVNLNAKGSDLVFKLVQLGGKIIFEGANEERTNCNGDIFEASQIKCVIDCACGVKDNDGERMVSCDICEVCQHTRCVGIPNNQEVPSIYLCSRCEQDILLFPCLP